MRKLKRHRKLDVYNRIEVSKSALLHNAEFFKRGTGLKIIPVVKSNAYGHGIEIVTQALNEGDFPLIAVDGYFEAQKIHKLSKSPILVMGMLRPGDFKKVSTKGIEFTAQDKESIRAMGSLNKHIKIHLDINTGMNRYGIEPGELESYLSLISEYPKLKLEGIMTHLADPDSENEKNITTATKLFDSLVAKTLAKGFKPGLVHIGQSASSMRLKSEYANSTRIGLSLYGLNPFPEGHKMHANFKNNLQPVLKLVSTISKINHLKPGDGVGYNYTFRTKKEMKIAVLPLGYYEGVDWRLGNEGKVKYGDAYLPIIGKVCMNHMMIDITGTSARVGNEVSVFSNEAADENSIDNIAKTFGLFEYAIPTNLAADVRRVLV